MSCPWCPSIQLCPPKRANCKFSAGLPPNACLQPSSSMCASLLICNAVFLEPFQSMGTPHRLNHITSARTSISLATVRLFFGPHFPPRVSMPCMTLGFLAAGSGCRLQAAGTGVLTDWQQQLRAWFPALIIT